MCGENMKKMKKAWDIKLRAIWILVQAAESTKCLFPLALTEEKTGQNKVRDRDMGNMFPSFGFIVVRQMFLLNG